MVPSVHNWSSGDDEVSESGWKFGKLGFIFKQMLIPSQISIYSFPHAILLPRDIYICIWNKSNVLLRICSLGLSRAQGLFVGLQYTLILNLCTNQHWTEVLGPLWGRGKGICLFTCVSVHLQASTTFLWITIMQSQWQLLQIMTDCKVNVFGAFPTTGKRTKTTCDVFNIFFDLHLNGNDDGICINTVKAFLQREELGVFKSFVWY